MPRVTSLSASTTFISQLESQDPAILNPGEEDRVMFDVYRDVTTSGNVLTIGQIVAPGRRTREQFPETAQYGVHFRKTYTPSAPPIRRGETPELEFHNTTTVLEGLPEEEFALVKPFGHEPLVYRSRAIGGRTIASISPYHEYSYEMALERKVSARALRNHRARIEMTYDSVQSMHRAEFIHGDAHLHNFMVLQTDHEVPAAVIPIDLAASKPFADIDPEELHEALEDDLSEIFREALIMQLHVGKRIPSPVFELSIAKAAELLPDEFLEKVAQLPECTGTEPFLSDAPANAKDAEKVLRTDTTKWGKKNHAGLIKAIEAELEGRIAKGREMPER